MTQLDRPARANAYNMRPKEHNLLPSEAHIKCAFHVAQKPRPWQNIIWIRSSSSALSLLILGLSIKRKVDGFDSPFARLVGSKLDSSRRREATHLHNLRQNNLNHLLSIKRVSHIYSIHYVNVYKKARLRVDGVRRCMGNRRVGARLWFR